MAVVEARVVVQKHSTSEKKKQKKNITKGKKDAEAKIVDRIQSSNKHRFSWSNDVLVPRTSCIVSENGD